MAMVLMVHDNDQIILFVFNTNIIIISICYNLIMY